MSFNKRQPDLITLVFELVIIAAAGSGLQKKLFLGIMVKRYYTAL